MSPNLSVVIPGLDPGTQQNPSRATKKAAEAHGIHEKTDLGGVYDQHWPQWYAAHMVEALAAGGLKIVREA